jgi:3-(3-hydroxy-phenyl)propionate hydroxylase
MRLGPPADKTADKKSGWHGFPTRRNYGLALPKKLIERILADWVGELAVPNYRSQEVTGLAQDETGVDVELADGQLLRARYLVGCGGRSRVRKAARIEFPGWDPTISNLIAEVELTGGARMGSSPRCSRHPRPKQVGGWRTSAVIVTERALDRAGEPTRPL